MMRCEFRLAVAFAPRRIVQFSNCANAPSRRRPGRSLCEGVGFEIRVYRWGWRVLASIAPAVSLGGEKFAEAHRVNDSDAVPVRRMCFDQPADHRRSETIASMRSDQQFQCGAREPAVWAAASSRRETQPLWGCGSWPNGAR